LGLAELGEGEGGIGWLGRPNKEKETMSEIEGQDW